MLPDRNCTACGRDFTPSSRHAKCPACRAQAAKKPCATCGTPIFRQGTQCNSCATQERSGENSPTWKGGRTRHAKGYILIKKPDHPRATKSGYVLEHILVMEAHLGRHLLPGETVHHLYGQRDDNKLEHLELWTKPPCVGIRARDAVIAANALIAQYPAPLHTAAPAQQTIEPDPHWCNPEVTSVYLKNGYPMARLPKDAHPRGRSVFEHILVMEAKIGRYLLPGENVHHRDGNPRNNDPANLELWTRPQPSGARVQDLLRWAHDTLARYEQTTPGPPATSTCDSGARQHPTSGTTSP